jgi:predicted cupin superfamily sugar epimerase
MSSSKSSPEAIRQQLDLEPLPLEGGHFRQTWQGASLPDGRPSGTTIIALLSNHDNEFSAMHRLPTDEIWHFHGGDPVELLLLNPATGSAEVRLLGADLDRNQEPQIVVPAGTWMGGRPAGPADWSLFSCTMTPGFMPGDYEGGDAATLGSEFPAVADHISQLCRPGVALRHPGEN